MDTEIFDEVLEIINSNSKVKYSIVKKGDCFYFDLQDGSGYCLKFVEENDLKFFLVGLYWGLVGNNE